MSEHQIQSLHPQNVVNDTRKLSPGLQLLSPSMQQFIPHLTSTTSSSHAVNSFNMRSVPSVNHKIHTEDWHNILDDDVNVAKFDSNRFTLASLRGKEDKTVEPDAIFDSNTRLLRVETINCNHEPDGTVDCALEYEKFANLNPLSCSVSSVRTTTTTDDFAMSQRQRHGSLPMKNTQRSSVRDGTTSNYTGRETFRLSSTAASAGFLMAKKKEVTAVVMRGWLQRRKGRVFKRWKSSYCLWKSDDSLCLYASEDTVNGRLEQRYRVLRVVRTDTNHLFYIIGTDADSVPRREEFRVSIATEWIRWLQVLDRFIDKSSTEQARLRESELIFSKSLNKSEEDPHWLDDRCAINPETNAIMPEHVEYEVDDGRRSFYFPRKQSAMMARASFEGGRNAKLSALSFFSRSSIMSITASQLNEEADISRRKPSSKIHDCPMIECNDQGIVPIMEIRASESNHADYLQVLSSFSSDNE